MHTHNLKSSVWVLILMIKVTHLLKAVSKRFVSWYKSRDKQNWHLSGVSKKETKMKELMLILRNWRQRRPRSTWTLLTKEKTQKKIKQALKTMLAVSWEPIRWIRLVYPSNKLVWKQKNTKVTLENQLYSSKDLVIAQTTIWNGRFLQALYSYIKMRKCSCPSKL